MEIMCKTTATAVGGREGHVKTEDGFVDLQLRTPKEMGGPGGGANPEDLLASGFAACYGGAIAAAARRNKVEVGGAITVKAEVGLGPNGKGGFQFAIKLETNIPGVDVGTAEKLAKEGELICPFANAVRGNVDVELKFTNK